MNAFRIATNILLASFLAAGGVHLLVAERFHLANRWDGGGLVFSGWSQYLLAACLFALSAFAAAIVTAWATGRLPMPPRTEIRPHPAYKGNVLLTFWYLPLLAVVFLLMAFYLAESVAAP